MQRKNLRIIARGGAIIFQKKWLLQMKKTFSSHDRKMKRIIPKHNESSWNTLERSHAEGERKKDETSLSHRHHKNFSFIHSYIWTNLLFYHDTLVWTLASFLTISTNHDKVKEKKYSLHIRTEMICVRCKIIILFFASSSFLLYVFIANILKYVQTDIVKDTANVLM